MQRLSYEHTVSDRCLNKMKLIEPQIPSAPVLLFSCHFTYFFHPMAWTWQEECVIYIVVVWQGQQTNTHTFARDKVT